jgi:hypothetical protein
MKRVQREQRPQLGRIAQQTLATSLVVAIGVGCSGRGGAAISTKSASAGGSLTTEARPDGRGPKAGKSRFTPKVCEGVDLRPEGKHLTVEDLDKHLRALGFEPKTQRERENLHLLDVTAGGKSVRLRVATLDNAREAGRDLHVALLEHGNGFWGVHRSNLAVLATPGPDEPDGDFALATKLPCWGVFTTAGRDDTFVVPGGYFEL